jgi:hypothetical protein
MCAQPCVHGPAHPTFCVQCTHRPTCGTVCARWHAKGGAHGVMCTPFPQGRCADGRPHRGIACHSHPLPHPIPLQMGVRWEKGLQNGVRMHPFPSSHVPCTPPPVSAYPPAQGEGPGGVQTIGCTAPVCNCFPTNSCMHQGRQGSQRKGTHAIWSMCTPLCVQSGACAPHPALNLEKKSPCVCKLFYVNYISQYIYIS